MQDQSRKKLPTGKVKVEVEIEAGRQDRRSEWTVTLKVNGEAMVVAQAHIRPPCLFISPPMQPLTSGCDLDSPVSLRFYDQAPFPFNGSIGITTKVAETCQIGYLRFSGVG